MKPAIGGEETVKEATGLSGVIGGGAWGKRRQEPERPALLEIGAGVGQPIVAGKRVMTVERRG
jgi:hypothetical protein